MSLIANHSVFLDGLTSMAINPFFQLLNPHHLFNRFEITPQAIREPPPPNGGLSE